MEMALPAEEPMHDRTLYWLTWLAVALSLGHHRDHLIRGNAVGWPVTDQVNALTISLVVYPIIATGLLLYHAGRVGPGFWALVSGGGAAFVAEAEAAPEELSAIANIMKAPPMPPITNQAHGRPIVMVLLCWAGEIEAGERAVARFRGLVTPFADMVRPMPHPEMYQFTEGGPGPDHEAARSLFLDAVELPTAEAIVEHLRASIAPLALAQLRVLGGAMALATADSLGMAALAEGIRALQAAQAGEVSQVGMGTAAAPEASRNLFRREGEYWTVVFEGSLVRLKDTKGLRHLARLLAHPGREFHATDLEAAQSRPSPAAMESGDRAGGGELAVRPDLGDAGALLDATAKAAYRARLAELRAELEEAEGFNDSARAAKARQEMEFLVGELARAVGLGGRDRRAASHAERARLNVTRAIRAAVANLAHDNPALGRHLAATIRTGRYCAYLPDPRAPIAWDR
jgi:hypothetical protein